MEMKPEESVAEITDRLQRVVYQVDLVELRTMQPDQLSIDEFHRMLDGIPGMNKFCACGRLSSGAFFCMSQTRFLLFQVHSFGVSDRGKPNLSGSADPYKAASSI